MSATTASTDKRTARDTVHNNSLFCSTMFNQQSILISQFSQIFNAHMISQHSSNLKTSSKQFQNSWGSYTATGYEITEKAKLLCNTHNDVIYSDTLMPFHQPGTGR